MSKAQQNQDPKLINSFFNLSFEDANKLPWTNDLIDEVIAMSLFMTILMEKEKFPEFWDKKRAFDTEFGPKLKKITENQSELRRIMNLAKLGTSRKKTSRFLSESLLIVLVPGIIAVLVRLFRGFNEIAEVTQDESVKEALADFREYRQHYRNDFLKISLGGTLKPSIADVQPSTRFFRELYSMTKIAISSQLEDFISYCRGLIDICYESGFECWWIPAFLLAEDYTNRSRAENKKLPESITADGLLGPIFPGYSQGILNMVRETKEVTERVLFEWLLISIQSDEARKQFALNDMDFFRKQLGEWGYRPSTRRWEREHFDMLFERLYFKKSVEVTASIYKYDTRTVKKQTEYLAHLLRLELPRAKYKKRSKN